MALPRTFPRWFFRNFTLLGICGIVVPFVVQEIAVVDPNLDANMALGGDGLHEAVIDLGPQCRKRDAALHSRFAARHFGTAKPARQLNLDAPSPPLHSLLDSPFQRAAKTLALLQLIRHVLRHQLSVDFGPGDFHRLDLDVTMGHVLEFLGKLIDLLAFLANNDADASREYIDDHFFPRSLDANAGNARSALLDALLHVLLYILADVEILDQQFGEFLLAGIPGALPVEHDAGATSDRTDFLAH